MTVEDKVKMSYTIPFQLGSVVNVDQKFRRVPETTGPLTIEKHLLGE